MNTRKMYLRENKIHGIYKYIVFSMLSWCFSPQIQHIRALKSHLIVVKSFWLFNICRYTKMATQTHPYIHGQSLLRSRQYPHKKPLYWNLHKHKCTSASQGTMEKKNYALRSRLKKDKFPLNSPRINLNFKISWTIVVRIILLQHRDRPLSSHIQYLFGKQQSTTIYAFCLAHKMKLSIVCDVNMLSGWSGTSPHTYTRRTHSRWL